MKSLKSNNKIYTKKGDRGETILFTGEKVPKNDPLIDALGTADECNSAIGLAVSFIPKRADCSLIKKQLETIQHALFDIGAALATPQTRATKGEIRKTRFDQEAISLLEKWIDEIEDKLPEIHSFILPGGHPSGAALHLARAICRRLERITIPLNLHRDVSDPVMQYLNRLSDYLFVASRYLNHFAHLAETSWQPHLMKKDI